MYLNAATSTATCSAVRDHCYSQ